ncbi:MAG: hypothetical protein J7L77_01830 [Clostridiales bacterium]|nr:hypothetical protein [Clostridiales bacterium]
MKQIIHIIVIALFMASLWLPLICTPFQHERERAALQNAENRDPQGTFSFSECEGDVKKWVKETQLWYQESFAFRSILLSLYNATHYLLRNYPEQLFGKGGHLFLKKAIFRKLVPVTSRKRERIKKNLAKLRIVCNKAAIPCQFIIIPAKETVHPDFLPNWLRYRDLNHQRETLVKLIRQQGFPVTDLSETLKLHAQNSREVIYRKYDNHWNVYGALLGYRKIVSALSKSIPEIRLVSEKRYSLSLEKYSTHGSKHFYLDFLLSETLPRFQCLDLSPVRVLSTDGEKQVVFYRATRKNCSEVFCPELNTKTVLFIRDSFLTIPSVFLNHSLSHSIYINYSKEGRCPAHIIEVYQPDVLVFALQENSLEGCLLRLGKSIDSKNLKDVQVNVMSNLSAVRR